jgi:hypothetical protein
MFASAKSSDIDIDYESELTPSEKRWINNHRHNGDWALGLVIARASAQICEANV